MKTSFDRRVFLQVAGASFAATPFFQLGTAFGFAADDWGGLPMGCQSYSLRKFDTRECVRHLAGLGFGYVEMTGQHLSVTADDATIADTKKLLSDSKITLQGHGVHRFTDNHEENRKYFDFAKRAGFKVLTADPNPDSFDSLAKLVEQYDVRIAIHNHGPGHRYDKLESVKKALEGKHKWIGACVDCGHFIRSGEDPVKCVLELGPRVFASHIKDEEKANTPNSNNVVIGKGHLDVVGLFKALKKVEFPSYGALSLEYEANPDNPIDDMRQCLEVAREAMKKVVKG